MADEEQMESIVRDVEWIFTDIFCCSKWNERFMKHNNLTASSLSGWQFIQFMLLFETVHDPWKVIDWSPLSLHLTHFTNEKKRKKKHW